MTAPDDSDVVFGRLVNSVLESASADALLPRDVSWSELATHVQDVVSATHAIQAHCHNLMLVLAMRPVQHREVASVVRELRAEIAAHTVPNHLEPLSIILRAFIDMYSE